MATCRPHGTLLNQMTHRGGLRRTPSGGNGPVGWDRWRLAPIHAPTPVGGVPTIWTRDGVAGQRVPNQWLAVWNASVAQ
jgi:hypothetical protein